jgi:hypothetical protein
MILLIGEADDDHVTYVKARLERRGAEYVQFNPRDFPSSATLTIEYDRRGAVRRHLFNRSQTLDLSIVRAVWHRARVRPVADQQVDDDQAWWVSETCTRLLSQLYECVDCLWVPERRDSNREQFNSANAVRPACLAWAPSPVRLQAPSPENKLYQLATAGHLGFTIPRTLVTNDPERFLDFYEDCNGELISKRAANLIPRLGGEPAQSFTTAVTRSDAANYRAVRYGPVVFQENVAKAVEVRATIVGAQVFAAEIKSQQSYRQQTDWRHRPEVAQARFYEVHSLPAEV